jgi:hypothetical protein
MPIKYCPHCNKSYTIGFDTKDVIHICNSGIPSKDQDDTVVIGNWIDSDGSSGVKGAQEVMRQGTENKLFGTRPAIEDGEKQHDLTARGARVSTHRQTQHEEYINISKEGLD